MEEVLKNNSHRPWRMPAGRWKFYQEWNDVIFLHWKVNPDQLVKYIPEELEIDLFQRDAWVSLVAFTMHNIRPRYLPSFPPISTFGEINIRTYVRSNDKSGVYFLSIEGGKRLSCYIARWISELPYRYSSMYRSANTYRSVNAEFKDHLQIQFQKGEVKSDKTELDKWLTERYALFQETDTVISEFEIHHLEWPIQHVEIHKLIFDYSRFRNIISSYPDLVHYSSGVKVLAWKKIKHGRLH